MTTKKDLCERPLLEILTNIESPRKQVKGQAIELLAMYLVRLLNLDFRDWLLRSRASKNIEVEIIADDRHIPFSRWQIQCRNASQVDVAEIAAAVGRSISWKPSIILSVTTGWFTEQVYFYATRAMVLTNFQILLLDGHDLRAIASDEKMLQIILNREAERVKSAKQQQLTPLCK